MANNERVTETEATSYLQNFFASLQFKTKIDVDGEEKIIDGYEITLGKTLYDYLSLNHTIPSNIVGLKMADFYSRPLLDARKSLISTDATRDIFFTNTNPTTEEGRNIANTGLYYNSKTKRFTYYQSSGDKQHRLNTENIIDPIDFFEIISPHDLDFTKSQDIEKFNYLHSRVTQNGLMRILFFKPQIQKFAQKRYVNKDALQKSALNALDPSGSDLEWINMLLEAYNILIKDPILTYQIYQFMPNLAKFLFDAIAATADYSNDGMGGDTSDPLNDPVQIALRMFRSFGLDKDGEPVFQPAWTLINTGIRIQKALEQFPFRANIPPRTPDIFHLRIGASNFYVPPVSINVDTNFRTGSLTGGAIRQKNTPKFNTGYKDTTISLRLYFPNYEEIWGISIVDGTKIDLTQGDQFKVDFSTDSEDRIDKFLSSLRGLVAMFKSSPIIPIKNDYLNRVHGITGVSLANMSMSTIPSFPFCLVVDLEMKAFNHKPFLPMIKDFNQAVHWGKYRHYMGRAASVLDKYINNKFLVNSVVDMEPEGYKDVTLPNTSNQESSNPVASTTDNVESEKTTADTSIDESTFSTVSVDPYNDWKNGNNIEIYMPERVQSKIFSPDTSTFRSAQEKILTDTSRGMWNSLLYVMGIDVNESAGYGRTLDSVVNTTLDKVFNPSLKRKVTTALDLLLAGRGSEGINEKVYDYLANVYILNNPTIFNIPGGIEYILRRSTEAPSNDYNDFKLPSMPRDTTTGENKQGVTLVEVRAYLENQSNGESGLLNLLIEEIVQEKLNDKSLKLSEEEARIQAKEDLVDSFNKTLYERFFIAGPIKDYIDAAQAKEGSISFNEWEVPMIKVDLNPKNVIVDGISLTMGNNLVPLQVQMQDEPTYQHIGGKDTYVSMSLTIFGEEELIKIRNIFEHISGLARLEHAAGVIGFLGIKNIISALAGVKYVLPLRYNVDTIPNFPHVYKVQLTLVDFDIFQQKREKLSSIQQQKFIEEFATKKNPFLRLKQLWGMFNGYPDLPLEVYDKDGNVVGCLDPDYYFRSFEMLDRDVVNNQSIQEAARLTASFSSEKNDTRSEAERLKQDENYVNEIVKYLQSDQIEELTVWAESNQLSPSQLYSLIQKTIKKYSSLSESLLLDYVSSLTFEDKIYIFTDTNFSVPMGQFQVGEITSGTREKLEKTLQEVLNQTKEDDKYISINPDNLTEGIDNLDNEELLEYFHGMVYAIPALEEGYSDKVPAMMQTAAGYNFGYLDRQDGRFYLQNNDFNVKKSKDDKNNQKNNVHFTKVADTQTPDNQATNAHMAEVGTKALAEYQYAYSSGGREAESIGPNKGDQFSVTKHWEKMLSDTSYRDISGRMIRAYPTYMLWLIDEGGMFFGTKVFDNFYGLQSIIDFSIVQSEDILGDTLIFRVSNMYSKLNRPETSRIFEPGATSDPSTFNMTEGIGRIIDTLLNRSRNFKAHFDNKYVVDIENIRLKPGVRVHLRGGYGSNPNSLQTLFNGMITNVEMGEIVTVTCQSDAIELSPIINSANKKGDSGKIDGGINTGMFLSEPRDLMVKLLSMGTSRFREAFAHATRGTVFSENKFGIRHFGSILYEPLNEVEAQKNKAVRDSFKNAIDAVSDDSFGVSSLIKGAWNNTLGSYNGVDLAITGAAAAAGAATGGLGAGMLAGAAGGFLRNPMVGHMRTLMANLSTQRDYEIFKRNIYPGNGLGVSQFLGGDLDSGWSTAATASLDEYDKLGEERKSYLRRLGDASWDFAIQRNNPLVSAIAQTNNNNIYNSSNAVGSAQALSVAAAAAGVGLIAVGMPVVGSAMLGSGLLGAVNGRSTAAIFETMGLLSSLDDDLPGFDEVSFRAQTYMRSVWDMFQMCARLLPNYIVAIRPFEDRSTVFFGKPHWLYTSGVVPVSTGFLSEESAIRAGKKYNGPKVLDKDSELVELLDIINKGSSPMADATAFTQNFEPLNAAKQQQEFMYSGQYEYAPLEYIKNPKTGNYENKLINFQDPRRMFYYDESQKRIAARLPLNKGTVSVGFHLPFGKPGLTEIDITEMSSGHRQIPQLPFRYQFPYFTDRKTGSFDGIHSKYIFNSNMESLISWDVDEFVHIKEGKEVDYSGEKTKTNWTGGQNYFNLLAAEFKVLSQNSSGLITPSSDEFSNGKEQTSFTQNLSAFHFTSSLLTQNSELASYGNILLNTAFMDANSTDANFKFVVMPFPSWDNMKGATQTEFESVDAADPSEFYGGKITPTNDDSNNKTFEIASNFEFKQSLRNNLVSREKKIYSEWGMPETAEDEQFYVAMKWPYKPEWFDDINLKMGYANQYGNTETGLLPPGANKDDVNTWGLYGSAQDYKNRKVLIYSPTTNTAVCCRPAYFLWGNQKDQIFNDKNINSVDVNALDINNGNPYIDAVVSPDAAYHLGILNTYGVVDYESSDYANYGFEMGQLTNNQIRNTVLKAMAKLVYGDADYDFYSDDKTSELNKFLGTSVVPYARSCYFTFVEDDFPLGVIPATHIKSKLYNYEQTNDNQTKWNAEENYIIGFGSPKDGELSALYNGGNDAGLFTDFQKPNSNETYRSFGYLADVLKDPSIIKSNDAIVKNIFAPKESIYFANAQEAAADAIIGGNWIGWYESVLNGELNKISKDELYKVLDGEVDTFKDNDSKNSGRVTFKDVFDQSDLTIAIEARRNYDEDYDPNVKVIAGNGRTLAEAREIWDFFRVNFHDERMVKALFYEAYALDPDDEEPLPDFIIDLIMNNEKSLEETNIFQRYTEKQIAVPKRGTVTQTGVDASENFEILLGEEFIDGTRTYRVPKSGTQEVNNENAAKLTKEAIQFSAEKFLDYEASYDPETGAIRKGEVPGLFQDLDYAIVSKYANLSGLIRFLIETPVKTDEDINEVTNPITKNLISLRAQLGIKNQMTDKERKEILSKINTPRKLYLFIVGWFRQVLWSDSYNRAWLVLVPNRRLQHYSSNPLLFGSIGNGGLKRSDGKWDFSPVYKAWQAFVDPNSSYAKKPEQFKKFLVSNAKEGDSATSWFSAAFSDTKDFWDKNIGIYFTAISDGLSGLLNMFKLSMAQMGYGLAEIDNLNKQANVLNKYLNDSIYYSLGNQGTLLRAVDNPFTREYGEPVVEVREPFQRIHYLSSFTHILNNKIQENINDVATVVTAVSDGKYPVTVALDKAASPERQTEKTVETGLYFDNIRGSGFFGILHPAFHPFETIRGISKMAQGAPDELTARRVALSHLKESVKDIYTGELTLIGSPDIRPHDLVYIADVYERMYGVFEVEQVVHHFTPDLGFITSITPNALVTVNDPARWFMTSWLSSWMSLQTIRNDTRYLLSSANNARTGIITGGQVSVDALNEALSVQMLGGIQYTHGHSALMKDVMANFTANAMPDARKALASQARDGKLPTDDGKTLAASLVTTGLATVIGAGAAVTATILTGGAAAPIIASGVIGGAVLGDMAWSGWKFIRDNVLDQHGCYVQYLSKSGQPMDAGLSYNQGMVVGKYHSKALLPGLLGVNTRKLVRTPEGYAYIRTDDLLKNLGWKEKEISDLVRHISFENALVNAQIIKYAGIGPEKAGLNQFFKVIVKVSKFVDGDTLDVVDVLRPGSSPFTVRFEGINTPELNKVTGEIVTDNYDYTTGSIVDPNSPGGRALSYVIESLKDKIFVLRIAPNGTFTADVSLNSEIFDAGAAQNTPNNYLKDTTVQENGFGGKTDSTYNRTLGTIFHRIPVDEVTKIVATMKQTFVDKSLNINVIKQTVKDSIYSDKFLNAGVQVLNQKFEIVYSQIESLNSSRNHFVTTGEDDPLYGMSENLVKVFNNLIEIKIIESLYSKSSEWPLILWDEYYSDGTPASLNWELVTANLASVYTKSLLYNRDSVNLDSENIGELGTIGN